MEHQGKPDENAIPSNGTIWPLRMGETLSNHDWFPLHGHRLLASDFVTIAVMEGRRADIGTALILWSESFRQDPAGTLPLDDRLLAAIARFSNVDDWLACKSGVLGGWEVVQVEGDDGLMCDRLGHVGFMMKVVHDMYKRKRGRDSAQAARSNAVRRKRVKDKLEDLGYKHLAGQSAVVDLVLETLQDGDMYITADNVAIVMKEHNISTGKISTLPVG